MIGKEIRSTCLINNQKEENSTIQLGELKHLHNSQLEKTKIIREGTPTKENRHKEDKTQEKRTQSIALRVIESESGVNASVKSATREDIIAYSIAASSQSLFQEEAM